MEIIEWIKGANQRISEINQVLNVQENLFEPSLQVSIFNQDKDLTCLLARRKTRRKRNCYKRGYFFI